MQILLLPTIIFLDSKIHCSIIPLEFCSPHLPPKKNLFTGLKITNLVSLYPLGYPSPALVTSRVGFLGSIAR